MKSALLFSAALALGMLVTGCDIGKPVDPADVPTTRLAFSLSMKGAPSSVARIDAELSRYGYDTLRTELAILGDSATGELLAVPIGTWKVTVGAFDAGNELLFEGSNYVDVQGGTINIVEVTLEPVSGTVTIVAWWPTGKAGSALQFDGTDDFVDVPYSNSLGNIDSALTIEAWVRPVSQYYNYIVCKGVGSVQYTMELIDNNYPGFSLTGLNIDYSGAMEYWSRLVIPVSLPQGKWTHVAVSYLYGHGIDVYINGELAHHAQATGAIAPNEENLRIGAYVNDYYDLHFAGALDEVRIWNVARSASEISNNMRKELEGSEDGLVAYWNFNETTGATVLHDKSSSQNNGTIFGSPLFVPSSVF